MQVAELVGDRVAAFLDEAKCTSRPSDGDHGGPHGRIGKVPVIKIRPAVGSEVGSSLRHETLEMAKSRPDLSDLLLGATPADLRAVQLRSPRTHNSAVFRSAAR